MQTGLSAKEDIYRPEMATVTKSQEMTNLERLFAFELDSGKGLGHMPGQFVEISIPGIGEAPISISSAPNGNGSFEMVVRNVGNVSSAMHAMEAGAKVGIRGPFGTTFPVDTELKGHDLLFICGGIGLVPVRSAIQYCLNNRSDYGEITILFGTKSPAERLFVEETQEWAGRDDVNYIETVDRADEDWDGNVGVVTGLMPGLEIDTTKTKVIICGPPIMYKFVLVELNKMGVADEDIYMSLERHMKCGVGKCGHCQINNVYVCQDGPVFKYSEATHLREAIS